MEPLVFEPIIKNPINSVRPDEGSKEGRSSNKKFFSFTQPEVKISTTLINPTLVM